MILNTGDWLMGLCGGLLIGLASALYLFGNGRIAGISGLLGGALGPGPHRFPAERIAFFVGLIGAPLIWVSLTQKPAMTVASSPCDPDRRRAACRLWRPNGIRLHQRAWRVRAVAVFAPLCRCGRLIHDVGRADSHFGPSRFRRAIGCAFS